MNKPDLTQISSTLTRCVQLSEEEREAIMELLKQGERARKGIEPDKRGDVNLFFELSYAHWLTIPRVLLEHMDDDWQQRFYTLFREFDETWKWIPDDLHFYVVARRRGKMTSLPPELCEYRHPRIEDINALRRDSAIHSQEGK